MCQKFENWLAVDTLQKEAGLLFWPTMYIYVLLYR